MERRVFKIKKKLLPRKQAFAKGGAEAVLKLFHTSREIVPRLVIVTPSRPIKIIKIFA